MKKYTYALCVGVCLLIQGMVAATDQHQMPDLADDFMADMCSQDQSIFDDAAHTSVMESNIEVEPISKLSLAARVVWDKILIIYLWLKLRYEHCTAYVRSKIWSNQIQAVPRH